jgi:lipoprotein-releasing system ATP-binding protein
MRRMEVGFVYQFHHLLPEFSALENAELPQLIMGRSSAEAEARAKELLGSLGLAERWDHRPAQLSGGEQQRVAIARALVVDPEILIADEPTGNLDAATGHEIADLLFDAVAKHGTTMVLVTHDESLAGRCDRTVRIAAGRIDASAARRRLTAAG